MPAPFILFMPGYGEPASERRVAHAFSHQLTLPAEAPPVVFENGAVECFSPCAYLPADLQPTGRRPEPTPDELQFIGEAHQSIINDDPRTLKAPETEAERDPLVFGLKDAEVDVLRTFFLPLFRYTTDKTFRYSAQENFKKALARGAGRATVVVAHGISSVVAFDTLFKMQHEAPALEFVTLGSPLGLRVVQRRLKAQPRGDGHYPIPSTIKRWTNVAAKGDPICADPTLGDEFRWSHPDTRVEDHRHEPKTGWPFHRWEGYVSATALRRVLARYENVR